MAGYIARISLTMFLFAAGFAAQSETQPRTETVDIGVLATRGERMAIERWQPMLDWLGQNIPDARFELHPYTLEQMAEAVKTQQIDFIITNPGQSVQLGRQYPLSWLATLRSRRNSGAALAIGSAFIVRADAPYQRLDDMRGKPIAAVSEIAFGGYLTLKWEMQQSGDDPARFFSSIDFAGFPLDALIYQLRDGYIEGAVLPACQLEDMIEEGLIAADGFRVLDNRAPPDFACRVSTRLYPNWSFAKTDNASEAMAKRISTALLALPENHPASIAADALGWTTPISQLAVDKLYQDLDMHPLQNPWWQEAIAWLKVNRQWGWLLLALLTTLTAYHFLLEYRFKKNQRRLLQTQRELSEKITMLEHAQRVAVVGELGASIAHEISQPLAAIQNYSQGGLVRINKGKPTAELLPILEHIQHQVSRASDIVQRLRNLINKRPGKKTLSNMAAIIDDTLLLLNYELEKNRLSVTFSCQEKNRLVFIDPVGFQQLILNVLRNSADACRQRGEAPGRIKIDLNFTERDAVIRIEDNGPGMAAEPELLQSAFYSTKKQGLGLGLAICRDVVKSHHGRMSMVNVQPHGCLTEITIPLTHSQEQ